MAALRCLNAHNFSPFYSREELSMTQKKRMFQYSITFFLLFTLFILLFGCQPQPQTKNVYSVAFILLTSKNQPATSEDIQKLADLKDQFREAFAQATDTRASLDTTYPVVEFNANADLYTSSLQAAKAFYKNRPDQFDFLVFFTVYDQPRSFILVKNTLQGIGLPIFDKSDLFGSNGRLQGIILASNLQNLFENTTEYTYYLQTGELLHLLGHRWCCYVGNAVDEGKLGILDVTHTHWTPGLESKSLEYDDPMGSRGILSEQKDTFVYTTLCNAPQQWKYHSFMLYLMGVAQPADVKETYAVWYSEEPIMECDTPINGEMYFNVNVYDVIKHAGERNEAAEIQMSDSLSSDYMQFT